MTGTVLTRHSGKFLLVVPVRVVPTVESGVVSSRVVAIISGWNLWIDMCDRGWRIGHRNCCRCEGVVGWIIGTVVGGGVRDL